jgi:MFS family permease
VGIGLFQIGYMDQTTATLPAAERGVAGSLVNVTRVVGAVIGAALITWLFEAWAAHHPELAAMRWSFASLGLLLLAVTGIVAAGLIDHVKADPGRADAGRP